MRPAFTFSPLVASSWPPGRPDSRSLKASSSPEVPVSVRETVLLQFLGLRPARGPDLPHDREPGGADGARRRRALGERGAVGGEDRRARRRPGPPGQLLARRQARVDEVRGPVDLAVAQRQLEAAGEGAEQVRSHVHGDHRVVALLADVAGAELGQGRLRCGVVVDLPEMGEGVLLLHVRRELGVHRRRVAALPGVHEALRRRRIRLHGDDHPAGKCQRRDDDQRRGPGGNAASALRRRATSAQSASIRT
jgi:hypothetical protein